jgi:hypothetical protein
VYEHLDAEYTAAMLTHDPQAISYFGRKHPYHAQCLLQLSHLLESQGDFKHAHELVKRSVYMFESCFGVDFNFLSGRCRLAADDESHTVLFAALYRHSQLLGKTGLPRAALEAAKVLLAFSPKDPT